jgi:hypothetical protein
MTMKKIIAALIVGTIAATSAWANHASAAVSEKTGQTNTWMIECGLPNGLIRRGFTKDSFPKGAEITVTGWQAKDDSFRANGSNIVTADGN